MPESVLTILKFCFLALIYLFLYRVVRVVVAEMRAPLPAPPQPAKTATQPAATRSTRGRGPARLRILEPARVGARPSPFTTSSPSDAEADAASCSTTPSCRRCTRASFVATATCTSKISGSRNGTLLNGQPVGGAQRIRRGDRVQFGHTVTEAMR